MANSGVKRGIGLTNPTPNIPHASLTTTSTGASLTYSPLFEGSQFWSMLVFNVMAYGAKGNGFHDDTAAAKAAVAACVAAGGGIIFFPQGSYKISTAVTNTGLGVYFVGAGQWATYIYWYGTGDAFRIYSTTEAAEYPLATASGGISGMTVDGTHATGVSNGLHMGDIYQYRVDIGVQNFTTAGSFGALFDNQYYYTEQLTGRVYAANCANMVGFNVGGATTSTNSFARVDLDVYVNSNISGGQNGVVIQNGALLYDGSLRIRGNWIGSSSALTNAVLYLASSTIPVGHSGAGGYGGLTSMHLDIQVEGTNGYTYNPYTIYDGSAGNIPFNCSGIMDFTQGGPGSFTPCNEPLVNLGSFQGSIAGDSSLCPGSAVAIYAQPFVPGGTIFYGQGGYSAAVGDINTGTGDFTEQTLTANTTVVLGTDYSSTPGAPQRITIIFQQAASGGPYTVAWPSNGSPSLASPTVKWANGVAPVMSPAASAQDKYFLETYDGKTWFGEAVQQQSALGMLQLTSINATTSGAITAVANQIVNTTAAATVTLPASPALGQAVLVTRGNHTGLITITANTGETINGGATAGSVALIAAVAQTNAQQVLCVAQSATAWTALGHNTDLGLGFGVSGSATLNGATYVNGVLYVSGGSSTVISATASTPTFASGTPAQLAQTTKDAMVYLTVGTGGTAMVIKIGPTSTPANTVVSSSTATSGELYAFRVPAGWYVEWTASTATIANQLAVTC